MRAAGKNGQQSAAIPQKRLAADSPVSGQAADGDTAARPGRASWQWLHAIIAYHHCYYHVLARKQALST